MAFSDSAKVWMNGALVPWKDATVHVATHALHYGTGVFEGIRAYEGRQGTNIFRLAPHMRRLYDSCRVYRMDIPFAYDDLNQAVIDTVAANGFKSCYIRPLVHRGYGSLGVDPTPCPVEVSVIVWEWDAYLGADALEQGVDVGVSSWTRMAPNTFPSLAKASANYANSGLIKMQSRVDGYAEGLALDASGLISEGSGQNLFIVRDGVIYTPGLGSSILQGVTRDTVLTLARDLGYEIREQALPREFLYMCDEAFFCGTAVEITPIRSFDHIQVGGGRRGPVTTALQQRFFAIITGEQPDTHGWLTPVPSTVAAR
ncbi:MAG: branched-chain amino acid transaminase [Vicinamibacteria bacterium]